VKGKGVRVVENVNGAHGRPRPDPDAAVAELGGVRNLGVDVTKPRSSDEAHNF
jgi:transketolase